MRTIKTAILNTLLYADIFDFPLKKSEIWRYLIQTHPTYTAFSRALEGLAVEKRILVLQHLYCLPRRKQLFAQRKSRKRSSHIKLTMASRIAKILQLIPTVWYIGVSGAVAMENAPSSDDIDLFIISSPHTVWLTRFLCVVVLELLGRRRSYGSTAIKNRICLNMFIDRSQLALPQKEQDLYSAHEVAQLKTLVNKHKTYEAFLYANRWALAYLPHAFQLRKVPLVASPFPFLSLLESGTRRLQLYYMKRKRTSEVVSNRFIRFHPQDPRAFVLSEYAKRRRMKQL